jgi:hypothetical protein
MRILTGWSFLDVEKGRSAMIDIFCVLCLKLHDDVFLCPDGFLRGSAKKIFLIDSMLHGLIRDPSSIVVIILRILHVGNELI